MTPRLTPNRLAALRLAAAHPRGNISLLVRTETDGSKVYLKAPDVSALEQLGYAASLCEHGHVNTGPEPYEARHRGCPHLFRITQVGRDAVTDRNEEAGEARSRLPAGGPGAQTLGVPIHS
ncbi:hypothetical protein [Streptomyces sp. NBC_01361]|uniref:hypothetical protein n=1 Tax=Streptomyces sp. NBC_01361 TaxID=2903838 RepID=UPI002E31D634|nr:hypothetical protein [Streptomyces sp. NBC_01361]